MKKFATPIAIVGTKQQFKDLIAELKALGYVWGSVYKNYNDIYPFFCPCLVTNYQRNNNDDSHSSMAFGTVEDRTVVYESNRELVLALAAMTQGKFIRKGEWVVAMYSYEKQFTSGKLYQAKSDERIYDIEIVKDDKGSTTNGWSKKHFRKATAQELIDHFNPPVTIVGSDKKDATIIGYNVKPGIDRQAALNAIGFSKHIGTVEYEVSVESKAVSLARQFGVLDILFEPVYQKREHFVEIFYGKQNDRKKLHIEIVTAKDGTKYALFQGIEFRKNDLMEVLIPIQQNTKFQSTYFDVGCNGQYHNISAIDIKKVIDAL